MKIRKVIQEKQHLFIFITNVVYIASAWLTIYQYNSEYFVENAFQLVNICFYVFVGLSFFAVRNTKFYFLTSLFLIVDLPVSLKVSLQNFLINHLHLTNPLVTYLLTACIFGAVIFGVFKYGAVRYLQVYLFIFYFITFLTVMVKPIRSADSSLRLGNQVSSISKNYYFLLFDEYPNEQIIRQYHICRPGDYPSASLNRQGFTGDQQVHSNFPGTEKSVTTFLTGSLQTDYNIGKAIHALGQNSFAGSQNYSFQSFSLFDNQNRPNSEIAALFFKNLNNLATGKFIPYVISLFNKRGMGKYTDWDHYHADAVTWLQNISGSSQPHVVYVHFFTPHIYPLVWGQSLADRIKNANNWMRKAIEVIDRNDPKAGVVIFSDHGLRLPMIPLKSWNRNMLYYRNIQIDTNRVNKNGLVDLTKSIQF